LLYAGLSALGLLCIIKIKMSQMVKQIKSSLGKAKLQFLHTMHLYLLDGSALWLMWGFSFLLEGFQLGIIQGKKMRFICHCENL